MAADKVILRDAKPAGVDLTDKQFTLVKIATDNTIVPAASGDRAYVLDSTPREGEAATYDIMGITKVTLGGAVDAGELLVAGNNGHAIAASGGDKPVVGQAIESGESGSLIGMITPISASA